MQQYLQIYTMQQNEVQRSQACQLNAFQKTGSLYIFTKGKWILQINVFFPQKTLNQGHLALFSAGAFIRLHQCYHHWKPSVLILTGKVAWALLSLHQHALLMTKLMQQLLRLIPTNDGQLGHRLKKMQQGCR